MVGHKYSFWNKINIILWSNEIHLNPSCTKYANKDIKSFLDYENKKAMIVPRLEYFQLLQKITS